MPLVSVAKARRKKTDYRGRRPTKARDAALQDQMEQAFTASWDKGIKRVKGGVSTQRMADAYFDKDYAGVMVQVPFEAFDAALGDAIKDLAQATTAGGAIAARAVPNLAELQYDVSNPRIQTYLESRTAALVNYVQDDFGKTVTGMLTGRYGPQTRDNDQSDKFQQTVQGLVTDRLTTGVTTAGIREQIGEHLRASIGLDHVSAGALLRASESGKFSARDLARYEDRLLDRRADRIARTEVAYALNEGQLAVWDASVEQGLISEGAQKVWVAEANPCDICEPMDGIMVALADDFLLPNGVTVASPPAHPCCRCQVAIQEVETDEGPNSNVQNYNP